jgi:hypothetical protein
MSRKTVDIIARLGAQDDTRDVFTRVDKNLKTMRTTTDKTGKAVNSSFRMMRGGAGQFGYQIQDIAVQLQGGQNALLIFGQQGSQIASIFGAGGAVAGAFIAVGAALATAFLPRLFGTEKALADVSAQMAITNRMMKLTAAGTGVLTSKFEELEGVSKDLARNALMQSYNASLVAVAQSQKDLTATGDPLIKILEGTGMAILKKTTPMQAAAKAYNITSFEAGNLGRALKTIKAGDAAGGVDKLEATLQRLIVPASGANDEFRVMAGGMLEAIDTFRDADSSAEELKGMLEGLAAGTDLTTVSTERNRDAVKEMVDQLREEAKTVAMTARARVIYNAVMKGATVEELASIARSYDQVEAYNNEQKALKSLQDNLTRYASDAGTYAERALAAYEKGRAAAKTFLQSEQDSLLTGEDAINNSYDRRIAMVRENLANLTGANQQYSNLIVGIEAQRQDAIDKLNNDSYQKEMLLHQARIQAAGQLAGAMAGVFREGTKEQRAFLAIQKGLAVGEAIMNMHRAISNANALPFPANMFAIGQATSAGLGAVAGIKATSFEGGGYTGSGIRAGGLDGRGGMPAIVHPNESIIDHAKGQGMGTNVNITINANDTRGFDQLLQSRRGQLISIINESLNNKGQRRIA